MKHCRLCITANGWIIWLGTRLFANASSRGRHPLKAFQVWSSGLYEFTRLPFGLCNSGSHICHMMEMCLGDQQFVTPLLYLDDICIFTSNINEMLVQTEMALQRLKDFNLKIKPKMPFHEMQNGVPRLCSISRWYLGQPEEVETEQNFPILSSLKEFYSFLGLASSYRHFIPHFAAITKYLHELMAPTHIKKTGKLA